MNELEELVEEAEWPPRSRKARKITLAITAVFAIVLVGVWTQRKPIARDFVERELKERRVAARYDITRIGFRTQRIENLIIGDPARPDLTADWVEIFIRIGLGGAKVAGVRAGGVRLRGTLINGTFSFGAVDRLLPPPTGKPFTFPDIHVDLADARMRLDLPNGPIGLKLEGRGRLVGGFRGKLAAVAPQLRLGDCVLAGTIAWLDLAIAERRPKVTGPVRATGLQCGGQQRFALAQPQAVVEARFSEALNQWQGSAGLDVREVRLGADRLAQVIATIGFEGRKADTRGDIRISAQSLAAAGVAGQGLSLKGAYEIGGKPRGVAIGLSGRAALDHAWLDRQSLARIASYGRSADGTPVGPLARALADAATRAARDTALAADFTVAHLGRAGEIRIAALDAASKSGARAHLGEGQGVYFAWPGTGRAQVDGALSLGGGGFPGAVVRLSQRAPGAPLDGTAVIAPYVAGGARLALTPVKFSAAGGGVTRFDTQMTLDGPLGDGRVTGLTLPLGGRFDGRGGLVLNPGCAPLSFASLSTAGLVLGRNRLTLCPNAGPALVTRSPGGRIGGGARVAAPRLSGRLGQSPVSIAAAGAEVTLGRRGFSADAVALRLGQTGRLTRLDIARLAGTLSGGAVAGAFSGAGGQIGNVPLILSAGRGEWSLKQGALKLGGALSLADERVPPRFHPLISDDFALLLKNGRITASGLLREPRTRAAVAEVDITHNLPTGVGKAVLDVRDLRFNESLQPDTLTPVALGVVANVAGKVTGWGEIRWNPEGVTSDGVFRTEHMDLAAAFGPVTAARGEIRFTDLLGLVTAPGQRIALGSVNPGIAVFNGHVDYRLLPDQKLRIEGGRWPFAGGELILEPAILDLGVERERRLTFKIVGLDAAQFINDFDFKDVNATGTFDGVLPMVFDEHGGRIEGGRLVVRRGGGTLAYVGQLSNEQLGTFAKLAFDALKSIRYDRLTIELNGAIDGEMVTEVKFAGVNQRPVGVEQAASMKQFMGLPFIFNITIKAPFRGLLKTMRSFTDPSLLIRQNLPGFEPAEPSPPPVQPKESESMR